MEPWPIIIVLKGVEVGGKVVARVRRYCWQSLVNVRTWCWMIWRGEGEEVDGLTPQ